MTALARSHDGLPGVEMRSPGLIARQSAVRRRQRNVLDEITRRWGGLTLLQCAVLYVVGLHAEGDGVFRLPAIKIVHIVGGGSDVRCAAIPRELAEFGLLEDAGGRNGIRWWRLSRLGQAVFREIAGEGE